MSIVYGKIKMPNSLKIEESTASAIFCRFVAEPLERGAGHTLGNSLRRALLTSIEAPAIISIFIEGVKHEYMAVEGIIEDVTNIVLNFKGALLRKLPDEVEEDARGPKILTKMLSITSEDIETSGGQKKITLGDVVESSNYEVVNPDLHLFTVTKPMTKRVELKVDIGKGYVPAERHVIEDKVVDEIVIDSCYSPVRLVNYFVEDTRIGQDTDYDKLIVEVSTDGRITPEEAVTFASQILTRNLEIFTDVKPHSLIFEEEKERKENDNNELFKKLTQKISEIELSVRSTNCLVGANIATIGELVIQPESDMLKFRNFGKKSLNEIKAKLSEMGLSLGMDLSSYGINLQNVKDKMKSFLQEEQK
ncbi:MAG: DNA-directed RNA polymerase subunit alpha [Chlamydiales bacterium]|nr:DNA-directed RNA polymerase subunit alpha [Chlamydiales bacterium]